MNDLTLTPFETPQAETAPLSTASLVTNPDALRQLVAFADLMAKSAITVPEHLRGKPSDCLAIVMQSMQWGMNPFAVAQKTHVVSGRLGYEAQLVNAVLTESGAITGHPHYEFRGAGPDLECRVGCVLRGEDDITWGEWYALRDVKTRNSPLWATNPRQQLGYLQLKFWARLYAPGPVLGVYTVDELEPDQPVQRGPRRKSAAPDAQASPAPLVQRVDQETGEIAAPAPAASSAPADGQASTQAPAPAHVGASLNPNEITYLRNKLKNGGISEQSIQDRFQVPGIEHLNSEQFKALKAELIANG